MINFSRTIPFLILLALFSNVSCAKKVKINVINEDENKGRITSGGEFTAGSTLILNAEPKNGYLFTGWYSVEQGTETALYFKEQYVMKVPNYDLTIKAKWENYSTQTFAFNFNESKNTYSISSFSGPTDDKKQVIIPTTHHGFPVNRIDANTFVGADISEIKNLDNIEEIGDYAFERCKVNELTLPLNLRVEKVSPTICDRLVASQKIFIPSKYFHIPGAEEPETFWGWKLIKNAQEESYHCAYCGEAKLFITN